MDGCDPYSGSSAKKGAELRGSDSHVTMGVQNQATLVKAKQGGKAAACRNNYCLSVIIQIPLFAITTTFTQTPEPGNTRSPQSLSHPCAPASIPPLKAIGHLDLFRMIVPSIKDDSANSHPAVAMSSDQSRTADPELLNIDPNGDLILDVSYLFAKRLIRVSSKALCLASPVFRAMLGSSFHFQEGQALQTNTTGNPVQIAMSGDDYRSLVTMLDAVHLRTRRIPTRITLGAFYRLAVVCDKYDTAELFHPWANTWKNDFGDMDDMRESDYEKWFAISWIFQLDKVFTTVTRKLILGTHLDTSGGLVTKGGYSVGTGPIPVTITGNAFNPTSGSKE